MEIFALHEAISFIIDEEIDLLVNKSDNLDEEGILPDKPGGPPPDGNTAPVDASPDMGEPAANPAPAGQTSDMGDALGGGGAAPTGAPGAPENDLDGDGMDDSGAPDMGGGDAGGLGGGFGGGGGGGGMDFGGEEGGEAGDTGGPAPPEPTFNPFEGATTPEEKLQVILDTAESIAETTQDPQKVLKSVKGLIQNGFANPEAAAKVIADLFDTNNPVLQQVSRRLSLFMTGV